MAILNVKSFPDDVYKQLRKMAEREHRSVAQQVVHILTEATAEEGLSSILELRGLGRELWRGRSAAEHVAAERDSWD